MQRCQEGTAGEWGGRNPRLGGSWVGESEGWWKGRPLPGLREEGCPGEGTGEEEVGTGGTGDKLRAVQAELGHPRDTRGHILEDGAGSGGPGWEGEQESLWAGLASTGGNILGAPHPPVLLQPATPGPHTPPSRVCTPACLPWCTCPQSPTTCHFPHGLRWTRAHGLCRVGTALGRGSPLCQEATGGKTRSQVRSGTGTGPRAGPSLHYACEFSCRI